MEISVIKSLGISVRKERENGMNEVVLQIGQREE